MCSSEFIKASEDHFTDCEEDATKHWVRSRVSGNVVHEYSKKVPLCIECQSFGFKNKAEFEADFKCAFHYRRFLPHELIMNLTNANELSQFDLFRENLASFRNIAL